MEVWLWTQAGESDEMGGIFSSEEKAVAVCTELDDYIQPFELDEVLSREHTINAKGYFPLEGKEESIARLMKWAAENNIKAE